ncbi:hypothetical protein M5689_006823 [Euphorbia peplus]|nr:hypothetical protein M5689_006823 [Euphorbia peplus]
MHDFENIVFDLKIKGIVLPDIVLVYSLIKKVPPSWSDFAGGLKQKPENFSFDSLLVSLRIEEKHRISLKQNSASQARAHIVENVHKPKSSNFKKNGFKKKFGGSGNFNNKPKNNNFNQKNGSECCVCGKTNHIAKNCFQRHGQQNKGPTSQKPQANMVTIEPSSPSSSQRYFVLSPELNIVFDSNDWWIDSGANVHACADKRFFSSYQVSSARFVSMGNESEAQVIGEGQIKLELSSGNFLVLDNVLHGLSLRKNLVSASLLDQNGFKLVLGSNKVVITRHGTFVGKCYLVSGLYKLNVVPFSNDNNKSSFESSVIECNDIGMVELGM